MVDTVVLDNMIEEVGINTTTGLKSPLFRNKRFMTGTVTLNGVTPVTVANTRVTANSVIVVTLKTVGGTVGAAPVVDTITSGTGFTIKGTAADTSVYNYLLIG